MENVETKQQDSGLVTKLTSRFLGAVFGYLAIGLLITAGVCFGFSYFVASRYTVDGVISETGVMVAAITAIAAAIASYIITFVNSIYSLKTGKAPWVGFLLYAICMGLVFSVILLAGIDFGTIGEALGLTALAFGVVFLIGYFSKSDLSPLLFVAFALLICICLVSVFWFVFYLINPAAFSWLDVGISVAVIIFCILMIAIEANRIGKIVEKGQGNHNMALYCAFNLYTNFLALFVRILQLVVAVKGRK